MPHAIFAVWHRMEIIMKDLTKGNIYKTFLLFAVPQILAGFLSQAYSIIDTVIAGRILSYDGLAAIGSTSAFIQFFSSIFWGYGVGFSIFTARLFGAKDYKKLKTVIYVNYILMMAVILALSILIILFINPIFDILSLDPKIRDDAAVYFIIYMLGSVFLLMNNNGVYLMNSLGSSSYPLFMSVLSTVLHIAGNLFTVKVLGMGVGGIAASTVLSALVVDIFYFIEVKSCFKKMGVDKYRIKFAIKPLKNSLVYSVPAMIQQMLMYFASVVISPMVNAIGSSASAAYVICLRVYDVNATIYQNSSKTLSNYAAQSIGAGKYENIKRGLRVGFLQGAVFVLPVLIATVIFARGFCSVFLPSGSTGEGLEMAVVFARYCMPFILFNMVNNLFHSFYRGVAAMRFLVAATFIGAFSRIIATYILVKFFAMNGVYLGWAISWAVECLFSLGVYFTGAWKSREIKKALA